MHKNLRTRTRLELNRQTIRALLLGPMEAGMAITGGDTQRDCCVDDDGDGETAQCEAEGDGGK